MADLVGTVRDLLKVDDLVIDFYSRGRVVNAVRGVSFSLKEGHTLAIVGESGSGKSVTALSFTRLLPPAPVCEVSGSIIYDNRNLMMASERELRNIRGKDIAYIFQDAATSLNPSFTIGSQIAEAVRLHLPHVEDVRARVIQSLDQVGIRKPEERYNSYPHELSGGMQQRVMIAMALVCEPRILVADEPTTALDVTIQKQIIDLLKELRRESKMSIILITHNFGIVKDFTDDVVVMFQGKIVESGKTRDVLENPQHPYTKALIECIPRLGQKRRRLMTIDYSTFVQS